MVRAAVILWWIAFWEDKEIFPILWPPDAKSQLIGKDPHAGKDWRQKKKRATEDEAVGWHHRLNGHEFEQTPGDSEGQGSLACCSPWGCKELGMTWGLNNNNKELLRKSAINYRWNLSFNIFWKNCKKDTNYFKTPFWKSMHASLEVMLCWHQGHSAA